MNQETSITAADQGWRDFIAETLPAALTAYHPGPELAVKWHLGVGGPVAVAQTSAAYFFDYEVLAARFEGLVEWVIQVPAALGQRELPPVSARLVDTAIAVLYGLRDDVTTVEGTVVVIGDLFVFLRDEFTEEHIAAGDAADPARDTESELLLGFAAARRLASDDLG